MVAWRQAGKTAGQLLTHSLEGYVKTFARSLTVLKPLGEHPYCQGQHFGDGPGLVAAD